MSKLGEISIEEKYRINAIAYLESANLLQEANVNDYFIAPCCNNLGISLELFLKYRLLRLGRSNELRKYGHRLMDMWNAGWAEDIRVCAEEVAPCHIGNIMAKPGQPAAPTSLTPVEELQRHLEWLAEGYGRDTDYSLRYPRGNATTVPSPGFLIPILEHAYYTIT